MKHDSHDGAGMERHLHDPIEDKLSPLEPLDLGKVHSIDDLVRAMCKTAFTGRQIGEAADVLEAMARDKDCFVVMTLAGAMTVAKQGLMIAELIDRGIVNAVVSTGALMAHGLVEATGQAHFRYNPKIRTRNFTNRDTTGSTTRWSRNGTWIMWKSDVRSLEQVGSQRDALFLQAQPRHRRVHRQACQGTGDFEIGLREQRAGLCAGLYAIPRWDWISRCSTACGRRREGTSCVLIPSKTWSTLPRP